MQAMVKKALVILTLTVSMATLSMASDNTFGTGPVFMEFGPSADVLTDFEIPDGTRFNIVYDTAKAAEPGNINKTLETAVRFMNMHVKVGIPKENINLAVVVHSKAGFDLTKAKTYSERYDGADNVNIPVIEALTRENIRIILCGQSAAFYGISNEDLLPGVEMALSAMTAHAVLQQQGYTLNPF